MFSCEQSSRKSTDEIIADLERKLDSLNEGNPNKGEHFADSLLKLDPDNHTAIITKAYSTFNENRTSESLKYFKIINSWPDSEPFIPVLLGWSYEREGMLDSAKYYYEQTLQNMDSTWQFHIGGPQLFTIVEGKQEGLKSLERNSHIPELQYLQLQNDINTYNNEGLSGFFPLFFEDNIREEFYVKIPDSLFDNGIINSMAKVELAFARIGINVNVRSTDSANKGYKLVTTTKYLPELLKTDTLGLKRL